MKHSIKVGLSFGLNSGVITTLGLIVGLYSGTHSALAVLGGIITIAIADSFSDALGIHVSEESENKHSVREIWESTAATFLSKFVVALSFALPVLLLPLEMAIAASLLWGLFLVAAFSYYVAKEGGNDPFKVVAEHLTIAVVVVLVTHLVGAWVGESFS